MKFWNAAPILRLLIPFITGILSVRLFSLCTLALIIYIALCVVLLFLTTFISAFNSYKNSLYYGCIVFTLIYCIGYWQAFTKTNPRRFNHFANELKKSTFIYVRIDGAVVEKEKSVKVIAQLISVKGYINTSVPEKVLLYFQKTEQALKLNDGDELILQNKLNEIPFPKNPGEFDYKHFMANKNIHQQAFIKSNQWIHTGHNAGNIFITQSIYARNRLLSILKQAQLKGDEFAVASALLVGYTDKLDADLLSAYSQTGAMHILSVSGLHVGIVFVVLNTLLLFLDRFKYGLIVKALILIFFLWIYAFISGLSPSVIRSAIMFSFIAYGKSLKKNSTIYNTLAASALLMLLYDPFYLFDVGFQLSYLAVIGIVAIQPLYSSIIKTDNWLFYQLLSLVTVSIAAQLATFPVSIYYFHQFPNYFLFTNLIAIPLSTGIIYLGITLLLFSRSSFIVNYLSHLFSWLVQLLNNSIRWISHMPYAITDGIFINIVQLIGMYWCIVFLMSFLYTKRVRSLYFFLSGVTFLLLVQLLVEIESQYQRKFVVYAFPQVSVMNFIDGKEHVLLEDSTDQGFDIKARGLEQYWRSLKLNDPVFVRGNVKSSAICIRDEFIQFYDKRIVVLKNSEKTKQLYKRCDSMEVDYVILSNNVKLSLMQIVAVYSPKCIVFDGSNKSYQVKKWEEWCTRNGQNHYSVMDKGALVIEF